MGRQWGGQVQGGQHSGTVETRQSAMMERGEFSLPLLAHPPRPPLGPFQPHCTPRRHPMWPTRAPVRDTLSCPPSPPPPPLTARNCVHSPHQVGIWSRDWFHWREMDKGGLQVCWKVIHALGFLPASFAPPPSRSLKFFFFFFLFRFVEGSWRLDLLPWVEDGSWKVYPAYLTALLAAGWMANPPGMVRKYRYLCTYGLSSPWKHGNPSCRKVQRSHRGPGKRNEVLILTESLAGSHLPPACSVSWQNNITRWSESHDSMHLRVHFCFCFVCVCVCMCLCVHSCICVLVWHVYRHPACRRNARQIEPFFPSEVTFKSHTVHTPKLK